MIPDMHLWPVIDIVSFPQQEPCSVECGVFLMKAIEQIVYDSMIMFTHEDMPKCRGEIATSILKHVKIDNYFDDQTPELPIDCEEGESIMDS